MKKFGLKPARRASEYASATVCGWLRSMGVTISMNPKGAPWCNGSQESFFGRFKVEFGDFDRFDTFAELLEALYDMCTRRDMI
jgi:transposase InsO family protein